MHKVYPDGGGELGWTWIRNKYTTPHGLTRKYCMMCIFCIFILLKFMYLHSLYATADRSGRVMKKLTSSISLVL